MQIERQGSVSVPLTTKFPRVIGGVCEFCGIKDGTKPSEVQYTLCDHFKEIGLLRCSYCDETRDPVEVVRSAEMNIHGHPDNPNKLVVVCDSYECSQKHLARFKLSKS
jgi:hypothetical protein